MNPDRIPELARRSESFEARYDEVAADPRSPAFKTFLGEVHAWLHECVSIGRLLWPGSPERRMVQGLVDYWGSRLLHSGKSFPDIDRLEAFDPQAGEALPDELFPYSGLLPVTETDRLFGRESQVAEYTQHLEEHPALLILSESGGGKSSIAMGGVLPALRQRHPDWISPDRLVPGTQPATTLTLALASVLGTAPETLDAQAVQAALGGRMLLIFIDQLEEVLTMCQDAGQQHSFSVLLSELVSANTARIIATLRIDHYERLAQSRACHPLFLLLTRDASARTLPPMSMAQIRVAIQQPADAVGLRFLPPGIVERLAGATANAPGGLPLLQFALQRLWYMRPRRAETGEPLDYIDEATYARLPTLQAALGAVAEGYCDELAERGLLDACKRLMMELTVIDERIEVPLRRRRSVSRVMAAIVGTRLASRDEVAAMIDGFVEWRVMVRTGTGDNEQIEVAHEALFRHWGRFQGWFHGTEIQTTLRETRQITRDALLWTQGGESQDLLKLKGAPLQQAITYKEGLWLDAATTRYVEACEGLANEDARREAAAAEVRQEAARTQRHARRLKWFSATVGAVAVVLGLGVAWVLKAQAEKAEALTTAVASLSSSLDALEALDLAYTVQDGSGASLAHALDRLAWAEMVFPRPDGRADFTPSGFAVAQLLDLESPTPRARIKALGSTAQPWKTAVELPLQMQPGERLAALDVGPPPATGTDARLVVVTFVQVSGARPVLSRMVIWRITEGLAASEQVAVVQYPPETAGSSDVAFAPDNKGIADVLWRQDDPTQTTLRVWADVGSALEDGTITAFDRILVTSVAYQTNGKLLGGRADGSVSCGSGAVVASADKTPVMSMYAAEDSNTFVAVHGSGSLTVGDCETGTAEHPRPQVAFPQNVVLRRSPQPGQPGRHVLTYTVNRSLTCAYVGIEGQELREAPRNCWVPEFAMDSALPILNDERRLTGYLALPNAKAPLLTRLHETAPDDRLKAAGDPAAARLAMRFVPESGPADSADASASERVALNVRGLVPPEAEAGVGAGQAELEVVDGGGKLLLRRPTLPDAKCAKLSPDGQRVLVAGAGLGTALVSLGTEEAKPDDRSAGNYKGAALTACAIGNGAQAKVVLGTRDGVALQAAADGNGMNPVSELAAFRLGSPVLDVAIDGGSRFVAVVGERVPSKCLNGMSGHPLRIWDLESSRPGFPVASTCLARAVEAIGPPVLEPSGWVLPVFEKRGQELVRFDYKCVACEDDAGTAGMNKRLDAAAMPFSPRLLSKSDTRRLYGFEKTDSGSLLGLEFR